MNRGKLIWRDTVLIMRTKYLTEDERREGRKRIYHFQTFNGIGFNFMGATPVYLLAIHFGANNLELGYISSVLFLTGIILVILPRLLAGKNLIKVQATAWFLRGIVILFYLLLFKLQGKYAIWLILIVYTLFSGARMVGMAVWNTLVRMVSDPGGRGKVIAQSNILNQTASVVARLVSAVVTTFQYFSGIIGILILQVLGVIFNTAAVLQLRKIPCRETVEYTKGRNVFVILHDSIKHRERRYPLLLKWFVVSIIVLNGLIIPFIRKEAGFSSNYVFLYSLVMAVAVIMSGLFARTFADRIGSRPLLIGMSLLLAASYSLWMALPVSDNSGGLPVVIFYILGFFTNFFLMASNILISRVIVNTMPEDESIGYNAMVNFVTAIFSAAAGVLGGFLINWGQTSSFHLFNIYSYLFVFSVLMSFILVFLSMHLIDKGSLTGRETAAILFSFEGLKAYIDIGKMKGTSDPVKKRTVLLSISENEAPAATEELKHILASPLSSSKGEVIKSLFRHPRPALLPELLKEAADYGSYHQLKAIFALGAYPDPGVEKLLLKLLDDPDPSIRSNAAKSLGRIGNKSSFKSIQSLALKASSAWDRINYLIALKNMDDTGKYLEGIFTEGARDAKGIFRQTYYSLCADLYEMKPSLTDIYRTSNLKLGDGLKTFLESTRDHELFYLRHKELITWFRRGNWSSLRRFCIESLNSKENTAEDFPEYLEALKAGIILYSKKTEPAFSENKRAAYDDALAAVYFTYQILKLSASL